MRHIAANVLTVLILVALAAAVAVGVARRDYMAAGPAAGDVVVEITSGMRMDAAAKRLAEAGAIPRRTVWGVLPGAVLFRVGARYSGRAGLLKKGEYLIPARASMPEILDLITSGRSIQYPITVPEGLTSWEVVELLRAQPVLTGEIAEVPAEGSLAPDTYNVDRGTDRAALLARMQEAQARILATAWEGRAQGLPLATPEEALILASIVEKETGVPQERGIVASVFLNRLRAGMRLETDPTVIYGITRGQGPLGRGLRRSELDARTDYNTYQIDGLPPTPIANPGRDSILAVLQPEESDYLFFVADGTGGHAFARTLAEHNRNVRAWRAIEAGRQSGQSGQAGAATRP